MSKRKSSRQEKSLQAALAVEAVKTDEMEAKKQKTESATEEKSVYSQSVEESTSNDLIPYKTNTEPYEPCLDELIKEMGQKSKMLHLTWAGVVAENEKYEVFLPTRLQKLIDEAQAIETNLLEQKEKAMNRLVLVSQALKIQ